MDRRVGSRELLSQIRSFGCDAELTDLDSADFAFTGNGDPEVCASPFIGIERKTTSEFCQVMRTRKLSGYQQIKMSRIYEVQCVIVEGIWRRNRDTGYMEEPVGGRNWRPMRGSIKYSEVEGFISSLEVQCGLYVWETCDENETAVKVASRYRWWQKDWDDHKTTKHIYAPVSESMHRGHKPSMVRRESTLCEKVASQLPGVDSKAVQVARHFGSVERMMAADEKEWQKVEGIGKIGAKRIKEALNGTV